MTCDTCDSLHGTLSSVMSVTMLLHYSSGDISYSRCRVGFLNSSIKMQYTTRKSSGDCVEVRSQLGNGCQKWPLTRAWSLTKLVRVVTFVACLYKCSTFHCWYPNRNNMFLITKTTPRRYEQLIYFHNLWCCWKIVMTNDQLNLLIQSSPWNFVKMSKCTVETIELWYHYIMMVSRVLRWTEFSEENYSRIAMNKSISRFWDYISEF